MHKCTGSEGNSIKKCFVSECLLLLILLIISVILIIAGGVVIGVSYFYCMEVSTLSWRFYILYSDGVGATISLPVIYTVIMAEYKTHTIMPRPTRNELSTIKNVPLLEG